MYVVGQVKFVSSRMRRCTFIKFFPAEINGGVAAIRALSAPLPELRFFPTGGVSAENVSDYLALESVVCVGGSWFIDDESLRNGDFVKLENLARDALEHCVD